MEICSSKSAGVQVFERFNLTAVFCHWETEAQRDEIISLWLELVEDSLPLVLYIPFFSLTNPVKACGGQVYPIFFIEN